MLPPIFRRPAHLPRPDASSPGTRGASGWSSHETEYEIPGRRAEEEANTVIHELFPYLRARNAAAAIEFYGAAFGAVEKLRLVESSGTVRDPFGYDAMIGHSVEDVAPEETQRRYDVLMRRA